MDDSVPSASPRDARPVSIALHFARRDFLRIVVISMVLLAPCFWHRHIVASDLGSHLYNAWLAQLIRGNYVPGLHLTDQWTNVLFDYLLDFIGRFFSLYITEKLAVSICVLIFFWGTFALAAAAAKRPPWQLTPALAMFAYGYTFHMGFFNYYLAIGLSFWGIALAWNARRLSELWLLIPLTGLVALAHPLGLAWLLAGSIYVFAAARMPGRLHTVLVALAIAALGATHYYFWHHNIVEVQFLPFFDFNGADQFLLFSPRYKYIEYAFLAFSVFAIVRDLWPSKSGVAPKCTYAIPAELYLILLAAVVFLPEGIRFANQVPALALLTGRLTSVSGAVTCCILAAMRPRRWHLAGYFAIASVFFAMVYQDTAAANQMEAQVEQLVRTIAPNQRVLGMIPPLPGSRILIQHMLDRACIGYCYSYGNYEAAAGLFRVRATPDNRYVMTDFDATSDMEEGTYRVEADDLPAYAVYPCQPGAVNLCIRPLHEGESIAPNAR
ncbi:MAG: hypothetical protein WA209_00320 [Candidatus Acidiferrales bacterium]